MIGHFGIIRNFSYCISPNIKKCILFSLIKKSHNLIISLIFFTSVISASVFYIKYLKQGHVEKNAPLEFNPIMASKKGPDDIKSDYDQRLKKADLFIDDFVPTEYTEFLPASQDRYFKQVQKRALSVGDEKANAIIVEALEDLTTTASTTTTEKVNKRPSFTLVV